MARPAGLRNDVRACRRSPRPHSRDRTTDDGSRPAARRVSGAHRGGRIVLNTEVGFFLVSDHVVPQAHREFASIAPAATRPRPGPTRKQGPGVDGRHWRTRCRGRPSRSGTACVETPRGRRRRSVTSTVKKQANADDQGTRTELMDGARVASSGPRRGQQHHVRRRWSSIASGVGRRAEVLRRHRVDRTATARRTSEQLGCFHLEGPRPQRDPRAVPIRRGRMHLQT